MRQYIRHPSDIPIEYELGDVVASQKDFLKNISEGGLSFQSSICLEIGASIMIRIPFRSPVFEEKGIVVWCRKNKKIFDVGVRFLNESSEFRLRMIEQICYIEHYKKEVLEKEDRKLSAAEAASEWIEKFAKDFPS